MLEQLLKNPAFAALYKNAPQLNNIEVPKLESGAFVPSIPEIPLIVQTPVILPATSNLTAATIINSMPLKKSKACWVLPVIAIGLGIILSYNIINCIYDEIEKSKKNKTIKL